MSEHAEFTACRECGRPGNIYVSARTQQRLVRPLCRDCHENTARRQQRETPVPRRPPCPMRDPDHDHLDFKAQDWWECEKAHYKLEDNYSADDT